MALSSTSRFISSSILRNAAKFSTVQQSVAGHAKKFCDYLEEDGKNIERALATVNARLDSKCVLEVMKRCSSGLSRKGLRFFIWAGLQSNYRHSSFMYQKACQLFGVSRNPRILFDVIEDYANEGCLIDIRSFKVVLNLCKQAKLPDEALWVLGKIQEFNLCPDTIVYNVVIRLFIEKGEIDKASELINQMRLNDLYPDMITYVVLIKGFCEAGQIEKACGSFKIMGDHGCSPNAVAYSVLIDGVCRYGSMEKAMEVLEEMEKVGGHCSPTAVTYTSVIQRLCEKGQFEEALKILDRMKSFGCAPNRVTACALIKAFGSNGQSEQVYRLIDRLVESSNISYGDCYSSFVLSLVQIKKLDEAEEIFNRMIANGIRPDSAACEVMIKELILEGRVLDGFRFCDEIEKNGHLSQIDSDVYSLLLVRLFDQRNSAEASKLARLMVKKGIFLKPPYADNIIEHMKKSGDQSLLMLLNDSGCEKSR